MLLYVFTVLFALFLLLIAALVVRLQQIRRRPHGERTTAATTLIVLGSGGHTAELLHICAALDPQRYRPRVYVCADTDRLSATAAEAMESERRKENDSGESAAAAEDYRIVRIRRSRAVHQSYLSAVRTTAGAFLADAVPLVWRLQPQLVLCNGPGTCVPLLVAAWALRLLGRLETSARLVFLESFCRVRSISLSGRLMQPLVDLFVVQWPELASANGERKYVGKLM